MMEDPLTREEMMYEDALELIEKSLRGDTVNRDSLDTAKCMLGNLFLSIGLSRIEKKRIKPEFDDHLQ